MKKTIQSTKVRRTPAHHRFEKNLDKVKLVIDQATEMARVGTIEIKRTGRRIQTVRGMEPKRATRRLLKAAEDLKQLAEEFTFGHFVFAEWTAVMLMTFVQEYVEECLVALAAKKPDIMKDVRPVDWALIRECQSLDDLLDGIRREWAQSRMRGNKVKYWFAVFENLGAGHYDPADCETLQHLLDRRNLIIHARSKPSRHYLKAHPSQVRDTDSGEVRVTSQNKHDWLNALKQLIDKTDEFVLNFGS